MHETLIMWGLRIHNLTFVSREAVSRFKPMIFKSKIIIINLATYMFVLFSLYDNHNVGHILYQFASS